MSIIRVSHDASSRWFLMSRETAQDVTLSYKARGILAYLLSKPDSWEWQETDLIEHGPDGKHAIRSGLKELKEAGYLTSKPERDPETGEFRWVKTIHERPVSIDRKPDNGDTIDRKPGDGPLSGFPSTDNRPLDNTDRENTDPPTPLPPTAPPSAVTPAQPAGGGGERLPRSGPGRTQPISLPRENLELLRAAGVQVPAALAKAATLPTADIRRVIAAAQQRPADKRSGWVASQCAVLLDLSPDDRAAALAAMARPPTRPPAPPPLPEHPPLSADERRAILARRF